MHRICTDCFTVSDVLRTAAELSLIIEPTNNAAKHLKTPVFSGRMLACEVQPGLTASAFDITYLSDQQFLVDAEPSLMCAVLLQGDDDSMEVCGYGNVVRSLDRPVLVGFSKAMRCRRQLQARDAGRIGFEAPQLGFLAVEAAVLAAHAIGQTAVFQLQRTRAECLRRRQNAAGRYL